MEGWKFAVYLVNFVITERAIDFNTVSVASNPSVISSNLNGMCRPVGSCKILGVLMTFMVCYSYILEILGVLNANFFLISRNIGGAIAPPAPPLPTTLESNYVLYLAVAILGTYDIDNDH